MHGTDHKALEYLGENLGALRREEVGGHAFFVGANKVHPTPHPVAPKLAKAIELGTLTGLAHFIAQNVDQLKLKSHLVVVRHDSVELVASLDDHRQRECVARAQYNSNDWQAIEGTFYDMPRLAVLLGSMCDDAGDRDKLIDLVSSVSVTDAQKRTRKGLSFQVSSDEDVTGDGWADVPNPFFALAPFRSFPEAFQYEGYEHQIVSKYLLDVVVESERTMDGQIKKSAKGRLLLADGNGWRPKATEAVAEAMESEMDAAAVAAGTTRDKLPAIIY